MFAGKLSEYSLPEIFQFLEQGQKTGLLTINTLPTVETTATKAYYFWIKQGWIVAAADRLDGQGLMSLLQQRNWLSDRVTSKIPLICALDAPLGICLKSQGILQPEQLKLLFRSQVVEQVAEVFKLSDGQFALDKIATTPYSEMTGLSIVATEATLMGLRVLQDWTTLAEKLPEPSSGLSSVKAGRPQAPLQGQEWQVWEFAKGNISLKEIAKQLGISVDIVRQIAFRLIVVNVAEEVFMLDNAATAAVASGGGKFSEVMAESSGKANVSKSFLQNLVGFLKTKA